MHRRQFLSICSASTTAVLGGCSALKPRIPVDVQIRNATDTRQNLELEISLAGSTDPVFTQLIPVLPMNTPEAYQVRLDVDEFAQGTKLDVAYRVQGFSDSLPVVLDCTSGSPMLISVRIMDDVVIEVGTGCEDQFGPDSGADGTATPGPPAIAGGGDGTSGRMPDSARR